MTVALDGRDLESQVAAQLEYLSRLARHLGITDPVEEYFAPVVGRWSDMHAEADRWRLVGASVEQVTEALNAPLGKLDAAWDGAAAESFVGYMQRVGLAGNDLADAMTAMADALDQTADGIREIVSELAGVLAETAETASEAMAVPVQGDARAREYVDMMRRPTRELFESVRQILEAFVQLCEGAEGDDAFRQVAMNHLFPSENWAAPAVPSRPAVPPVPSDPVDTTTDLAGAAVPGGADLAGAGMGGLGGGGGGGAGLASGAAAAGAAAPLAPGNYTVTGEQAPRGGAPAAAAAGAPTGGGGAKPGMGGMPMAPMMPMGGQGQGGDAEHKNRSRVVADPTDIFGKPEKASTPVIGADD